MRLGALGSAGIVHLLLLFLSATSGHAATWANAQGGAWSEPANWTEGSVPVGGDVAITVAGSYTITNLADLNLDHLVWENPTATLAGPGTLQLSGLFDWRSGVLGGPATAMVIAAGGFSMTGSGAFAGRGLSRQLVNLGPAVWSDATPLVLGNGAVISNAPGAVFRILGGGRVDDSSGNAQVVNAGELRIEVTNQVTLGAVLRNTGTLAIQAGTLEVAKGMDQAGTLSVANGARLTLAGGTHNFRPGSLLTGAGELLVAGGTATLDGTIDLQGAQVFRGGTVLVNGQFNAITNQVTVAGANVTFAGNYNFLGNRLEVQSGTASFRGVGRLEPASLEIGPTARLDGTTAIVVSGPLNLNTSTLLGSGTVIARGGLRLSGNSLIFAGRTLVNQATAIWSNSTLASISLSDGGTISNALGATFDLGFDGLLAEGGRSGGFANSGTFLKSAGTGVATFTVPFHNQGLVRVEAGTLNLSGGGNHSGSVVITNLAQLTLGQGTHNWGPGSSISGPGDFRVSGGTANLGGTLEVSGAHVFSGGIANLTGRYVAITNLVAIDGGTANFLGTGPIRPASLVITNLGVLGGDQPIEVAGLTHIGLGTIRGSGPIVARGELQLFTGNLNFSGRTLVNQTSGRWFAPAANGAISISDGGTISNAFGATFDLAFDGLLAEGGRSGGFANSGTFSKSAGTGVATFTAPFHNHGVLRVESGTLNLSGGGNHSGSVVITNLAQLTLGQGTHNWAANSSIAGPGDFRVNGGTANLGGTLEVSGAHIFSGGIANLTGRYVAITNQVAVVGGTANFLGTGPIHPASLVITNLGVLGGDQPIEVSGLTHIGLGTIRGSSPIVARGELQLFTGNLNLAGRTLVNQSAGRWFSPAAGGAISVSDGGMISNAFGAIFDLAFDGLLAEGGRSGGFVNAGSFRKSAGTGLANFTAPFHNQGLLRVEAGTLNLSGGGDHSGSAFIAESAQLALANGTHNWSPDSSVSGSGTLRVSGGIANLAGRFLDISNVITVAGGTANFLGTTPVQPASLFITNLGVLGGDRPIEVAGVTHIGLGTIRGSGPIVARGELQLFTGNLNLSGRALVNQSSGRWLAPTAGAAISVSDGGMISNAFGATFDLAFDGLLAEGGRSGGFVNAGTFRKSAGTNLANFTAPFHNRGLVRVEAGTLNLSGGGNHSGSVVITNLAQLTLGGGTHDWGSDSSISGPGDFRVSGGTANLAGSLDATGAHIFSGGVANLTGRYVAITNQVAVVGGTANFLGTGPIHPASLIITNLGALGGDQPIEVSGLTHIGLGTIRGSGPIVARGELQLFTGNLNLAGRTLVNQTSGRWFSPAVGGSISISDGGTISNAFGATFDLAFDGLLAEGGRSGGFVNAGAFRKSAGTNLANFTAPFLNQGLLQVESGTLRFQGLFTQTGGGLVLAGGDVTSVSPIQLLGGVLTGSGRVTGVISNAASVRPGDTRGPLVVEGNYRQVDEGKLELRIGGLPALGASEPFVITNLATLAGTLEVTITNGFVPPTNAVFPVLRYATRSGTFGQFRYPSNEVGMALEYTPSNVLVRVTNLRPTIDPLEDQRVEPGQTLSLKARASDADRPAQSLTFSLSERPAGMEITADGSIRWSPGAADEGATTKVTVIVTDNGTPSLSAATSFRVSVGGAAPVTAVSIQPGVPALGQCTLQFRGAAGTTYVTQYALSVLGPWIDFDSTAAGSDGHWQVVDRNATNAARFYRVR